MTLRPSDVEVLAGSGFVGHWCGGLSLRPGDCGWRLSLSAAGRRIYRGKRQDHDVVMPTTCNTLAYRVNESEMCNSCSFGSLG